MISRLENKDVDVIKHPVHLTPLVDEIIDTMQVEIDKKHLQVDKELEEITSSSIGKVTLNVVPSCNLLVNVIFP